MQTSGVDYAAAFSCLVVVREAEAGRPSSAPAHPCLVSPKLTQVGTNPTTLHALNTEGMNEYLKELCTQVTPSSIAVVICDGAGWHQRSKELDVPENIRLLPLPPYSPELNPMENVWDYLRQNKLCAQVWDAYDDILEAYKNAWNFLIDDPARIQSIGSRSWAYVNV
jgi:hypothetical protein